MLIAYTFFNIFAICFRHNTFKVKLLEHLRKKHAERESREKYMTETYSRLVQQWLRKVEKVSKYYNLFNKF